MQEIATHIFMETGYPGVTLGAINWSHGLILIDSPLRCDDARLWRSSLLNLGGGIDRLVINLDAHYDRTLGVRALECTVIGHEKINQAYRTRAMTFKASSSETGSEWELYNSLGSVRWAPPEITFTEELVLHWEEDASLRLEYHPGPATGSSWVVMPHQKVIFLGDAVVADQPPFLAQAGDLAGIIAIIADPGLSKLPVCRRTQRFADPQSCAPDAGFPRGSAPGHGKAGSEPGSTRGNPKSGDAVAQPVPLSLRTTDPVYQPVEIWLVPVLSPPLSTEHE